MLNKLIILYSFIITLNPAIKLCATADLKKNATSASQDRMQSTFRSSVTETEDTWQPTIQTHNWLAEPTILTPTLFESATPTRTPALWASTNVKKNLTYVLKQKHGEYIYPHNTYHNYTNNNQLLHRHRANSSKRHIRISTASALSTSSSAPASESLKDIKLRSHNNHNRGSGTTQHTSHHHSNHHQLYPFNNIEALYPQIQIPKDITSQAQEQQRKQQLPLSHHAKYEKTLISSQINLNHVENVTQHKHHTAPSSSVSYWHYLQQPQHEAKHNISHTPQIDAFNTNTNSNDKMSDNAKVNNSNSTILTKTLNSFTTNENLSDHQITNTKNHQYHIHQQHYRTLPHSGFKSVKTSNVADKNLTKATVTATDNEQNFNLNYLPLKNILNSAQEFFDNIKDIIMSDKDNNSADSRSDDDDDDDDDDDEGDDDYDILYTNEDKTNIDDVQILNSSALKDPSTTETAAIAAAVDLLNIKNILLSSPSIAEVQGRQRQIDKDTMKFPPSQDTSQIQSLATKATAINETQATGRLWNLSTYAPLTQPSSLSPSLTALTSKALKAISSGRKLKKVKKKFLKFLLPLLLAYKLKFLALIPLLIGGLTLLVGTTGLAGFFFALFTAVISLKSGRSAIVVKKY